MKNICFLVLLCVSFGYSQEGRVTYKVENTIKSDSERVKKLKEELELIEYTLKFNEKKSNFIKERTISKNEKYGKLALALSGFLNSYFQFSASKEALYNQEIKGLLYKVDNSYKMKGWELTSESTIINDYTCYKAILMKYNDRYEKYLKTTAWYTPEIPAGYGPLGYGGLPGLILQLERYKSVFTATKIVLNPKRIKMDNIKNGPKISVQEMVKLKRSARKVTED